MESEVDGDLNHLCKKEETLQKVAIYVLAALVALCTRTGDDYVMMITITGGVASTRCHHHTVLFVRGFSTRLSFNNSPPRLLLPDIATTNFRRSFGTKDLAYNIIDLSKTRLAGKSNDVDNNNNDDVMTVVETDKSHEADSHKLQLTDEEVESHSLKWIRQVVIGYRHWRTWNACSIRHWSVAPYIDSDITASGIPTWLPRAWRDLWKIYVRKYPAHCIYVTSRVPTLYWDSWPNINVADARRNVHSRRHY